MSLPVVTKDNFQTEVLDSSVPVVVKFFATWCGPCKMMTPVMEKYAQSLKPEEAKVVEFDVDSDRDFVTQFKLSGVPTTVLFKNSEEVTRLVGYANEDTVRNSFAQFLEKDKNNEQV